jgi:hypothetical protein
MVKEEISPAVEIEQLTDVEVAVRADTRRSVAVRAFLSSITTCSRGWRGSAARLVRNQRM